MITGELKNKVDSIWDTIWTGGITSPIRENGDISREDLIEKSPFDNYDILTLFGENIVAVLQIVNAIHDSVSIAA